MSFFASRRACAALLALGCAPLAQAEYLWIDRSAGQPHAVLSDYQPSERLALKGLLEPQLRLADGKFQALEASGEAYAVSAPAAGDVRVLAKKPDGNALTIYEAREGRSDTKAQNDLELVPLTANGNVFQLHWKGTVVSASQVNVHTSAQWAKVLKPAADGSVTLDTPFPGRYVLEVAAQINGSATVDGKKYDSVTHVATLSFEVK